MHEKGGGPAGAWDNRRSKSSDVHVGNKAKAANFRRVPDRNAYFDVRTGPFNTAFSFPTIPTTPPQRPPQGTSELPGSDSSSKSVSLLQRENSSNNISNQGSSSSSSTDINAPISFLYNNDINTTRKNRSVSEVTPGGSFEDSQYQNQNQNKSSDPYPYPAFIVAEESVEEGGGGDNVYLFADHSPWSRINKANSKK